MSGAARTISIRLSTDGAEDVRRQLEGIGTAGATAMRRVQDAVADARPALAGMSGAVQDLSRSLSGSEQALARLRAGLGQQGAAASAAEATLRDHGDASAEAAKTSGDLTDSLQAAATAYGAAAVAGAAASRGTATVASAFTGLGGALVSVVGSLGPVGIGLGVLAAAAGVAVSAVTSFDKENTLLSNTLRAVGRDAEIATGSLRSYVRALQDKGLSEADATSVIGKFARNSGVSDTNIARVSSLAPDAAVALASDASAAADKLAAAFSGSYAGVKQLDDALNFLTVTERDAIRTMLEHGDRAGALDAEFAALKRRIEGMDESMAGPFEQAMRRLSTAWRGFTDTIANDPNIRWLLGQLTSAAEKALNAASSAVTAASNVRLASIAEVIPGQAGVLARMLVPRSVAPADATASAGAASLPSYDVWNSADSVAGVSLSDQQRQLKLVQDLTAADRISIEVSKAQESERTKLRATLLAEQEAAEKGLTGAAREELIRTRVTAALANQTTATKDHARTIEFYIADAAGEVAAQLRLADATEQGTAAAQRATAADKAEKEARKLAQEGHEASAAQIAKLTDEYTALAQAQEQVREAQNIQSQQDQLEYIRAEQGLLSASVEERERELAVLKERQRVLAGGGDPNTGRGARDVSLAGEVAAANAELTRQKTVITEVGNLATQVFDQVGSAITDAFATGSVVRWGNVLRAVLTSVLQEVAKLALINPLLNSLVGGNRTTLSDMSGLLGSSSSGSGGVLSSLGDLFNLGSSGTKLFGYDLSGSLGDGLGLSGLMGTTLWGGTTVAGTDAVAGLMASGAHGMIAEGAISSAGVSAMPGATIGGMLGGVGIGFGAGSMLGSALNPAHATQASIGAGAGAAAGAAIGSIIPGVGTIIGGLIGGLDGGAGGSLFGPKPSDHTAVGTYDLATGAVWQSSGPKETSETQGGRQNALSAMQQAVATLEALAGSKAQASIALQVGTRDGSKLDWTQDGATTRYTTGVGDIAGIVTIFKNQLTGAFTDAAGNVSKVLDATRGNYDAAVAGLTYLHDAYEKLTATTVNIGTVQTQIDALNKTFGDAITQAKQYGLAEDALVQKRDEQIQAIRDAAAKAVSDTVAGYDIRLLRAQGKTTEADLAQADIAATAERTALTKQLTDAFGDAYKATADYASITGKLNDVLKAERDAIEQRNQAENQSATRSLLTNLTIGSQSALAPEQQYFAGLSLLNDARHTLDAGGALSDYTAIAQQVLPVARDFLGTSERYAALVAEVASVVSTKGGDTAGLGSLLQAQVDGTDALRDTFARYGQQQVDVASATLTEIRRLASSIEALIARKVA